MSLLWKELSFLTFLRLDNKMAQSFKKLLCPVRFNETYMKVLSELVVDLYQQS